MKTATRFVLLGAAAVLATAVPVLAQQTQTASLNVTAQVSATAKLTLDTAAISFANADPDTVPSIAAAAITVDAKAKTTGNGAVTLQVQADGPLTSGSDTIAASSLTWTATGAGFVAGTMSSASGQSLGSWTGPGNRSGTQTYSFANSWAYATGNYSMTVTYTLTAP